MARPAIRCFSTDLPPLGCDIVCQPIASPIADMIVDSGCSTCSSLTHHARRFDLAPSGPCDCHVQDIACLGCGNTVGYYIHRPCFRCLAQRLRIKQRGFQHLWTFYQDNVFAVQREDEHGEPVGWEDLPVPPAPTATAIRPSGNNANSRSHPQSNSSSSTMLSTQGSRSQSQVSLSGVRQSDVIESSNRYTRTFTDVARDLGTYPLNPARRSSETQQTSLQSTGSTLSINYASESTTSAAQSQVRLSPPPSASRTPTSARAQWLSYMSQRVAAERIIRNPQSSRESRRDAMRTFSVLHEQERSLLSRINTAESSPSNMDARDPTPPRPSTQTPSFRPAASAGADTPSRITLSTSASASASASTSTTPTYSGTPSLTLPPPPVSPSASSLHSVVTRRDEVMEPLSPSKTKCAPVPPPAGLSNWLFQVGLDCMAKWEEGTLSR
ncbi:Protein fam72a [Coemansia sp. Benny D115]|nr:Protein fam72a [Coemansia sp. Benny D115]